MTSRLTWGCSPTLARPSTRPVSAAGSAWEKPGSRPALCVNQEVGNVALDDRCRGFTDGLAESGGTVEVLQVNLNNPTEAQARIEAALSNNPDIDGILALGPTGAEPALEALRGTDQLGKIQLATFDLSPDVLDAIESGDMLFAIDSQQYMQGYLPIVLLTLYATNLNTIANPVLMTGPGFVTKENAAAGHRPRRGGNSLAEPAAGSPLAGCSTGRSAMQVTHVAEVRPAPEPDERVAKTSRVRRLLVRPEMGAAAGAIGVWIFFAIAAGDRGFLSWRGTANYLEVAAQYGILAVAVALLMIGGEFDLSIGSAIGGCGIIFALLSVDFGWNVWLAMLASLAFALVVGRLQWVSRATHRSYPRSSSPSVRY